MGWGCPNTVFVGYPDSVLDGGGHRNPVLDGLGGGGS